MITGTEKKTVVDGEAGLILSEMSWSAPTLALTSVVLKGDSRVYASANETVKQRKNAWIFWDAFSGITKSEPGTV